MPANPFATSATPAMRRPIFEVGFGDAAAWRDHLLAVDVRLGIAPTVDRAELWFASVGAAEAAGGGLASAAADLAGLGSEGGGPPAVQLGDEGSIALGYEDSGPANVLTGTVVQTGSRLDGRRRVLVCGPAAELAGLRFQQSYAQQTAGDVVSSLTSEVGVETGAVEAGIDLAFFALDDRGNAWDHIAYLAKRCGYLAYFDAEGGLQFAPPASGSPVHTFTYGEDLVALDARNRRPVSAGFAVIGEGAAGSQGGDAWCWLVKDPASVRGEAGDGRRLVADGALRAGEPAAAAAEGLLMAHGRGDHTVSALVPGTPQALPGAVVAIEGAPDEAQNGEFIVWRVHHRYDKRRGFTSRLLLVASGGGGLDLGRGGLL